jgi:hypothetical protein
MNISEVEAGTGEGAEKVIETGTEMGAGAGIAFLIDTKPCGVGIMPSGTGTGTGAACVCWGVGFLTGWDGTAAFTPGAVGGIPDGTGGCSAPPPPTGPE